MSQPPEYPGTPADPHGGSQNPPGYPPAPNYGAPPGYGAPPPGYGAPPPGYGSPPPGYGAPPPGYGSPAPGYGAPPSGGYPPASYGAPPAGYPASGYGGQPAQKYSIGEAFTWSWNKLSQNALALIVSYLIYRLIAGILSLGFRVVDAATTNQSGSGSSAWGVVGLVIMIVLYVLSLLVEVLTWTALITGCLDIADGKPVSIGSFFRPRNFAMALVAAFMLAVFTLLGLVLLIIPGMIFVFLASLTLYFVVDRSMTPWDALKASIATVRSNVGDVLLALLATIGVTIVGLIACCVGVIVAVPLNTLIWTYTYRKLSGGYVVPLEQPGYQAGPPPGYQPS